MRLILTFLLLFLFNLNNAFAQNKVVEFKPNDKMGLLGYEYTNNGQFYIIELHT